VRRGEHKRLRAEGDLSLTGTKYDWLRSLPDKRSAEAVAFRGVVQNQPFSSNKDECDPPANGGGMLAWNGVMRARREGLAPGQARSG